jgi:hypothetical protein
MSALDFVGQESNWLGKPVDQAKELQIQPTAEFEVAGRWRLAANDARKLGYWWSRWQSPRFVGVGVDAAPGDGEAMSEL